MNTAEDIGKGFQPFYDRVTLSQETAATLLDAIKALQSSQSAMRSASDLHLNHPKSAIGNHQSIFR